MKNMIMSLLILISAQTGFARTQEVIKNTEINEQLLVLSNLTKMHFLNLGTSDKLGEDVRLFESLERYDINPIEVYIVIGNGVDMPVRNYMFGERMERLISVKKLNGSVVVKYSVHSYDQNGDDISTIKKAIVKMKADGNLDVQDLK